MKKKIVKKKKVAKKPLKEKKIPEGLDIAFRSLANGNSVEEAINEVTEYRKALDFPHSYQTVYTIVLDAKKRLIGDHFKESGKVVALHIARYNKDIIELINTPNPFELKDDEESEEEVDEENLFKIKNKLISCYYQALASMHQKEKVLKMHNKGFLVSITNKLNIDVLNSEKRRYNLSGLSAAEKIDFLSLLMKAKKNDFEIGSVILRPVEDKQEIIDIAHEVVQEKLNVDLIKHEEIPIKEPPRNNTAVIDIKSKLQETLMKKAAEEFKKAGGKNIK